MSISLQLWTTRHGALRHATAHDRQPRERAFSCLAMFAPWLCASDAAGRGRGRHPHRHAGGRGDPGVSRATVITGTRNGRVPASGYRRRPRPPTGSGSVRRQRGGPRHRRITGTKTPPRPPTNRPQGGGYVVWRRRGLLGMNGGKRRNRLFLSVFFADNMNCARRLGVAM